MHDTSTVRVVRAPVCTFEPLLVRLRDHLDLPDDYTLEQVFYVAYCIGSDLKTGSTHAPVVYERHVQSGTIPDCLFTVVMMPEHQASEQASAFRIANNL